MESSLQLEYFRFIENALANSPYTVVKADGILINRKTNTDHLENTEKVFWALKEIGATVKKKKYIFFVTEIEYVGFTINKKGIHLNPHKMQ